MTGVFPSVRRERSLGKMRAVGLVLAAAYLAFVGWLVLRPQYAPWVAAPNLHPLATIREDLARPWPVAARRLAEGLGLLAPLGVLLPMTGARLYVSGVVSFMRTVFAALMASLVIEFVQTVVPGQIFDVDALLLNTVGAALAYLTVVPAARRALRRRLDERTPGAGAEEPEAAQGSAPRVSRVGATR